MKNVTVITGGAGGMGFAAANIMGSKGHAVLLCDVKEDALQESAGALARENIAAEYAVVDVSDLKQVEAAVQIAGSLGCVTNVIHTAGLSPVLVEKLGEDEGARAIMRVNALGTVNVIESFYPLLREGASVVCFTSSACYLMPQVPEELRNAFSSVKTNRGALEETLLSLCNGTGRSYMFSKLFVMDYVRMNAGRFGKKGCRINSIAPGRILTPMHRILLEQEPERRAKEMEDMPLGRYGCAYEIGNVVEFLCSYRASYINGIDILVDEGTQAFTSTQQLAD